MNKIGSIILVVVILGIFVTGIFFISNTYQERQKIILATAHQPPLNLSPQEEAQVNQNFHNVICRIYGGEYCN